MNTRPNFRRATGDAGIDLRHYDLDLSVARDKTRLGLAGTFIFSPPVAFDDEDTVSTSLLNGYALIRFGRQLATPTYYEAGNVHNRDPFDEIFVTNPAQAGRMLRLYYGTGNAIIPFVTRSTLQNVGGESLHAHTDVSCGAGAATLLHAATVDRHELIVSNIDGATPLRIAHSAVAANKGIPLAMGGTLFLTTQDDVYAWNANAGAVDVAVTEIV